MRYDFYVNMLHLFGNFLSETMLIDVKRIAFQWSFALNFFILCKCKQLPYI